MEKIPSCIDHDFLGRSVLVWWPEVLAQYGKLPNTIPLYKSFRSLLVRDLRESNRLAARGLTAVLVDIVHFMY